MIAIPSSILELSMVISSVLVWSWLSLRTPLIWSCGLFPFSIEGYGEFDYARKTGEKLLIPHFGPERIGVLEKEMLVREVQELHGQDAVTFGEPKARHQIKQEWSARWQQIIQLSKIIRKLRFSHLLNTLLPN